MNVLSLFDGISCGRVALQRAGINVSKYYASEIDKYAIKISKKNFPDIIHLGDVQKINFADFNGDNIDMLIGGSPCQDLSICKSNREGLAGKQSGLFWEYIRLKKMCQPKYFLFENVASMPVKDKAIITKELGVAPIMINSALVSAQQRKRFYWTNIPGVTQPEDKGIMLKDIVFFEIFVPEKYWYDKEFAYNGDDKKVQCTIKINGHRNMMKEVYNLNGKCNTLLCDGDRRK